MNPIASHVVSLLRKVAAPRPPRTDCISAPPNALDDSPSPLLSCNKMISVKHDADRHEEKHYETDNNFHLMVSSYEWLSVIDCRLRGFLVTIRPTWSTPEGGEPLQIPSLTDNRLLTAENYFRERFCLKTCSPNECAVYIGLCHEFCCILRFNAATVLNAYLRRDFFRVRLR